jgi:hypothetical protein
VHHTPVPGARPLVAPHRGPPLPPVGARAAGAPVARRSRAGRQGPGMAATARRRHAGGVIMPRPPRGWIAADRGAGCLERHPIRPRLHPGVEAGGHAAGAPARTVGPVRGGLAPTGLALTAAQLPGPLPRGIGQWRPLHLSPSRPRLPGPEALGDGLAPTAMGLDGALLARLLPPGLAPGHDRATGGLGVGHARRGTPRLRARLCRRVADGRAGLEDVRALRRQPRLKRGALAAAVRSTVTPTPCPCLRCMAGAGRPPPPRRGGGGVARRPPRLQVLPGRAAPSHRAAYGPLATRAHHARGVQPAAGARRGLAMGLRRRLAVCWDP